MSVTAVSQRLSDLGEGPHWDVSTQKLYYVDAFVGDVCRLDPATGVTEAVHLDGIVTFVIPYKSDPSKLLITLTRQVRKLDFETGQSEVLAELPAEPSTARFNDGKCDSNGRAWTAPQFQLHTILWVAVSSTVGFRVQRRHDLQSVCLQNVVLVDQTDGDSLGLSLGCKVDSVALTNQSFHLFGPLKQHLGGKHFVDDDDVQHEVLLWMRQQPKEFYAAGIGALIKRWDKCINIGGDYAEK
ncbi:hypothetical protein AVEN_270661-1 [Araneus ventricosus]|uniref:SMP-30/Gluconolactonase/LRE-like region domain-containing protein n=1 Tax=Araneus ventricosus TaxID=182803 RepID=A0A4Y2SSH1_ARAVE|nr:hypothetical protein AVEN_270661-1 [Araneus ventricosus]